MWPSVIEVQDRGASGDGGAVSPARSGNDPGILVSHFPESVRHLAFACGVRYGVRSTLMLLVAATRARFGPNLRSLSRIRYVGVCPYAVASRNCCAIQGSVGARVTCTWMTFRDCSSMMKNAKSGRKKRSVTCKQSQAHISAA
jgi:hypothetical protein